MAGRDLQPIPRRRHDQDKLRLEKEEVPAEALMWPAEKRKVREPRTCLDELWREPVRVESLVISDGESWFFRRRIMQPVFVHRHVAEFARIMVEQTALMLDAWDGLAGKGQPVDVVPDVGRLTLGGLAHRDSCFFTKPRTSV